MEHEIETAAFPDRSMFYCKGNRYQIFYCLGNISQFNIWSRWRNISEEFVSSVRNCRTGEFGDQVDWRLLKLKNGIRGDVRINTPDSCSGNSSKKKVTEMT